MRQDYPRASTKQAAIPPFFRNKATLAPAWARYLARHLASNHASARVLAKLGMVPEWLLRQFAR